jgi:uncharacterized protein YjbI with pentapeptide repeats
MSYREQYTNTFSPAEKEYEQCTFTNCVFNDLSGINFIECTFEQCNLSNTKLLNTGFQECTFTECKLVGCNFSKTKEFGFAAHFMSCNLSYVSFDQKKLFKSVFRNCNLAHANFTQADLSRCTLTDCDCSETVFMETNLSGVDFTTNYNFMIDPTQNIVKKTRFASHALSGLLQSFGIIIE